jgi:hypothetical protein
VQLHQDSTQPYPNALSTIAQANSFLTSRVAIDVTFTPDFSDVQLIENSIKSIVPARIFPIIKLHYPNILLSDTRAISAGMFFTMTQKTTPQTVVYGAGSNQGQTAAILESQ